MPKTARFSKIGRRFAVPLLARVLGTNGELAGRLNNLARLEFVFPNAPEPEPAYTFKHALTQDVVYATLLVRRRRQYHAAAGLALEELFAGHLDEVVELLAFHFARSDESEKAVDYAILAAEKAQRRWAIRPARRPGIAGWAFSTSSPAAPPEVPLAYCRKALEVADAAGLAEYSAFAQCSLTHVSVVDGDLRTAVAAGTSALPVFERSGNLWWACRTLWGLSMAYNVIGDWANSLASCERGLAYGQKLSDLRLRVVGLFRTGSTHILRGDPQTGVRFCDEALALSSPVPFDTVMIKAVRALGQVKAGQAQVGMSEMREALAWFDRSRLRYTRSVVALWLAEAHLRQDDREAARGLVDAVLTTSREVGYRHLEAVALRLLGEILTATDPAAAGQHLDAAQQTLEQIDARNDLAKTLVARARLFETLGQPAKARPLLEQALKLFEALGTIDEPARIRAALSA